MIHLQSNQRLYISEDLIGYVDKLKDEGTIVNAVDFLKLGFAFSVSNKLDPAGDLDRHELTSINTLGNSRLMLEAVAQWYAQTTDLNRPTDSEELLRFICALGVSGARQLKIEWESRSKSQIQRHICRLAK